MDWHLILACLIGFIFGIISHSIINRVKTIGIIIRDISDPDNPRFRFEFEMEPDECINGQSVCFKIIDDKLPSISQD